MVSAQEYINTNAIKTQQDVPGNLDRTHDRTIEGNTTMSATITSSKKAVRELKALRTTDRSKKAAANHRCCRCCRCWF